MSDDIDLWSYYQEHPVEHSTARLPRQRGGGRWLLIWFAVLLILTVAAAAFLSHRSSETTTITSSAPTVDCATVIVMRDMSLGTTGDDVTCLQLSLGDAGFPVPVTGKFDDVTQTAVKAFQEANGRTVDGVVGPRTGIALGLNFAL